MFGFGKRNTICLIVLDKHLSRICVALVLRQKNVFLARFVDFVYFDVIEVVRQSNRSGQNVFYIVNVLRQIDRHFGVEACVESDTETDVRTCRNRRVELQEQITDEGFEARVVVAEEVGNPFTDCPLVVACVCADGNRALNLRVNTGNGHVAVFVEQACVLEGVVLQVFAHRHAFTVVVDQNFG